jgi:alginate O-acetyltransferase complex protein AlgI
MISTPAAAIPALGATAPDPQAERSRPNPRRFTMLLVSLALLLITFKAYSLEQPAFFSLACLVFGGFAFSYWLPFRFKETFLILLSLAGAFVLLGPAVAGLLIAAGLMLFAIVRSGLEFRWKVGVLLGILVCSVCGRATGRFHIPQEFWPVFGAVFMFRMIVYLYDVRHMPGPVRLKDYVSYFFLLPNYYFLLFPVIDFQTFRKSYFKRDIHLTAQQGVWWILRGTTHLLLYRVIYQLQAAVSPPKVPVATAVVAKIILCYLLYLRISGQFHIIVGMLHLFGYDLPETNRRYLLAHSINDFWRRINIYWKDFMVKVFYFPVYFKLRRKGEVRAQLLATLLVFLVTWFLHVYQFFWLQGKVHITLSDTLFWTILGTLVMANVWIESRQRKRLPRTGWVSGLRNAAKIAATFAVISVLWSMWSADGMSEWFYFLKSGNV